MRQTLFEDPKVTPFVECPNCRRLLQFGLNRCPDCFELIEDEYAFLSGAVVLLNTKACAMANTIKTVDITAPLSFAMAALAYVTDQPPALLFAAVTWPVLALLAILLWFIRFGRFDLGDEDYLKARRDMRIRFLGWLVVVASLVGFLYVTTSNGQWVIR
jgi:RNA polymerase subunit RPABC4/transcription elongation factor Spt4